jgi:uroporphyrinogen III methyltransferase/synthase
MALDSIDLPADYDSETLAESLSVIPQERVLIPESNIARPILADRLIQQGALVTVITAYQTVCGSGGIDIPNLLAKQQVDAITFTSSSTISYFVQRLHQEAGRLQDAVHVCAACIGPKTAVTAQNFGFQRIEVASEHTVERLIHTLARCFDYPTK